MQTVRPKFTGYERDTETDLDYAQARYYAKNVGRFTSVDPLMASARTTNPKTWNRYVYALNNPLKYTDPDGMDVNILDEKARDLVLKTLPEKIREKVQKAIERIGVRSAILRYSGCHRRRGAWRLRVEAKGGL